MKYGRTDSAHADFRAHGCEWEDTSSVGKGFPDAIATWRKASIFFPGRISLECRLALLEIKSGAKAKTKKKTAEAQAEFAARFPVWRIATLAEADELIKWLRS